MRVLNAAIAAGIDDVVEKVDVVGVVAEAVAASAGDQQARWNFHYALLRRKRWSGRE